jgi:hypothetical protein
MWMCLSAQLICLLLCACATVSAPHTDSTSAQGKVAAEIARICALPETEREAEIKRIRRLEGLTVVCSHD